MKSIVFNQSSFSVTTTSKTPLAPPALVIKESLDRPEAYFSLNLTLTLLISGNMDKAFRPSMKGTAMLSPIPTPQIIKKVFSFIFLNVRRI